MDFFRFERRLQRQFELLRSEKGLDENKRLVEEYAEERLYSDGASQGRVLTEICLIRYAVRHLNKSFLECEEIDFKKLIRMKRVSGAGQETLADFAAALRRFMRFVRKRYGYPKGHSCADIPPFMLALFRFPPEVANLRVPRESIKKKVARKMRQLPASDDFLWELVKFAANKRDAAIIALFAENGNRVGGIGSLRVGDVVLNGHIAEIYIEDKTMDGEPVIFTRATRYLKEWLDVHPARDNPEAPLWISLRNKSIKPISYSTLWSAIKRAEMRYNAYAKQRGLPEVRFPPKYFRCVTTRRDIKRGVPPEIIKRQRGWSPTSVMPGYYAAFAANDVKENYEKEGLTFICPKCREPYNDGDNFCIHCGEPLNDAAREMKSNVERIIVAVLEDDRLRKLVFEKIMQESLANSVTQNNVSINHKEGART